MKILPASDLPEGDLELKQFLNYNPPHNAYTRRQPETGRNPDETDRGGWRMYNRVYSKYISYLRNEPIKILEIGGHTGYGWLAWAKYFPKASIYGMEVDKKYSKNYNELLLKYEEYLRVKPFFLSSTDPYSWVEMGETFDIIIDDGSHLPTDQVRTLRQGWNYLNEGGYYFIEDISTRYYNPSADEVAKEILALEVQGYPAVSYSHENTGWAKILANKDVWERYGVTEQTPKKAMDYIAVIHKKKAVKGSPRFINSVL